MSWCQEHDCPSEACERQHDPSLIPPADDSGEWEPVVPPQASQPIRGGIGCFIVCVGIGLGFCLVQWAMRGFPKFWQ